MEIAQIAVLVALAWMIIALVSNKVPFGAIGLGIPFILILTVNQYRDYLASSSCGNSRRP